MKTEIINNEKYYNINDLFISEKSINNFIKTQLEEKNKSDFHIPDISEAKNKNENELAKIIDNMLKSKKFFKYCVSLLININPGPNLVKYYLNLKSWLISKNYFNSGKINIDINKDEPHLYTFIEHIHKTLINENKDQVISILGSIGSGKTFNLMHIIEYFSLIYGVENKQLEIFDLIHKSVQLIHIFSSVYRENNIESSSSGFLLKLGFNSKNYNVISFFDIDAAILDFSLPFSENGRTFSILHALAEGANYELKKICNLSENKENLDFFKELEKNIENGKIDENKFILNDLEIWNRFDSLTRYIGFSSNEVMDIIRCLSFILNLYNLSIKKINYTNNHSSTEKEGYEIVKNNYFKNICDNIDIQKEDLEKYVNIFSNYHDAKNFIKSLMKQTYYIIFEFILTKVKTKIKNFFTELNINNDFDIKNNKYIYLIDFPGQAKRSNLGGLTTNLANECLNMYTASNYYNIVNELFNNSVIQTKFLPLQSFYSVSASLGQKGLFEYLSNKYDSQIFKQYKKNYNKKLYNDTIKFIDNKKFSFKFSHKLIEFNFDNIFLDSKSVILNGQNELLKNIFSLSNNIVISTTYKKIFSQDNINNNFINFYCNILQKFFKPIKSLKPFVIYCFHSRNSYKLAFAENDINMNNIIQVVKEIKNGLVYPILLWKWYGFKEWISVDNFVNEFSKDFEKIKNRILMTNNLNPSKKKFTDNLLIKFNTFQNNKSIAKFILESLISDGFYLLGDKYIFLKSGTLKKIRKILNSMIETAKYKTQCIGGKDITKNPKTENSLNNPNKKQIINKLIKDYPLPRKKDDSNFDSNKSETDRNELLKNQCFYKIIGEDNFLSQNKIFNIYYYLNNNNENNITNDEKNIIGIFDEINKIRKDKEKAIIKLQNNIRGMLARKKFMVLYYIEIYMNKKIVLIQSVFRGYLFRKKFKVNFDIIQKIKLIQRFYRYKFNNKGRKKIKKIKNESEIINDDYNDNDGFFDEEKEEENNDDNNNDDNEFFKNNDNNNKDNNNSNKDNYIKKTSDNNKIQKIIDDKKNINNTNQKSNNTNKDNIDNTKKNISNNKNTIKDQKNINSKNNKKIPENKEKNKNDNYSNNKQTNNSKIQKYKDETKPKNEQETSNQGITNKLLNETTPKNIIDILLFNRLSPDDNAEYLQKLLINKTPSNNKKIANKTKIEEKLTNDENMKQKNIEALKNVLLQQESLENTFHPKITPYQYYIEDKLSEDFLSRIKYYKIFRERNIENLRVNDAITKNKNLIFKPNISPLPIYNPIIQKNQSENKNAEYKIKNNNYEEVDENNYLNKVIESDEENTDKEVIKIKTTQKKTPNIIENNNNYDYKLDEIWPKEMSIKYNTKYNDSNEKYQ